MEKFQNLIIPIFILLCLFFSPISVEDSLELPRPFLGGVTASPACCRTQLHIILLNFSQPNLFQIFQSTIFPRFCLITISMYIVWNDYLTACSVDYKFKQIIVTIGCCVNSRPVKSETLTKE